MICMIMVGFTPASIQAQVSSRNEERIRELDQLFFESHVVDSMFGGQDGLCNWRGGEPYGCYRVVFTVDQGGDTIFALRSLRADGTHDFTYKNNITGLPFADANAAFKHWKDWIDDSPAQLIDGLWVPRPRLIDWVTWLEW